MRRIVGYEEGIGQAVFDQWMNKGAEMNFYVFLMQRSHDKDPWPCVYTSQELAEKAPGRCSHIAVIHLNPGTVSVKSEDDVVYYSYSYSSSDEDHNTRALLALAKTELAEVRGHLAAAKQEQEEIREMLKRGEGQGIVHNNKDKSVFDKIRDKLHVGDVQLVPIPAFDMEMQAMSTIDEMLGRFEIDAANRMLDWLGSRMADRIVQLDKAMHQVHGGGR